MVNIHQLVLEITVRWNRNISILLFISLLFSGATFGQETDPLSKKDRRKFNEIFFEAEKQKNLGNSREALELYEELYKLTDENATVAYELARIYASEGYSNDAIFYAERAAELDPDNKWYQFLLSQIYGNFAMHDKQIEVLNRMVELDTVNPDYRYELAMAYLQNGEPRKAIGELDNLEKILGINDFTTDQKKKIYLELGELENAAIEIERLIEAFPKNLDYYGSLAQLYMANGLDEEAFDIYQKMLEIDSSDPRIHLELARYYREHKQYDKSLEHLKIAILSPALDIDQKVPVLLTLFEASESDTNLRKEAYDMLKVVTEIHSDDPKAFAIYGDYLSRDGENIKALKAYKKAVSLEGGNRFQIWEQIILIEIQSEMYDSLLTDGPAVIDLYPNQPLPYLFTGVAYNLSGQPFEAVGYLKDGLNYVLGSRGLKEQFYTQLAGAYHELGEHKESDEYFDKALTLNRDNPTVLNNYAYYLSERGEKLDKALEMTERSNTLSPSNPIFLDTWAWILYKMERYPEALSKMEEVMKLGVEGNGEVLEHYGDILYKNGRASDALEQWKKAKATGHASDKIDDKINSEKLVE